MSEHDGSMPQVRTQDTVLKTSILAGIGIISSLCLCSCLIVLYSVTWPLVARQQLADAATVTKAQLAQVTATAAPRQTATAQALQEERMTATAQARTATAQAVQATVTSLKRWDVILSDSFDDNRNRWSVGSYSGKLVEGSRTIAGGKYRWELKTYDGALWRTASAQSASDFTLTVEGQRVGGALDATYGVFFREDYDGNYYLFEISDDQEFHLALHYQNEWVNLVDWTYSAAIAQSGPNRLTVSGEGPHMTFFVNDRLVAQFDDKTVNGGWLGLAVELWSAEDTTVFEFDSFELRAPPPNAEATSTALAATIQALRAQSTQSAAKTATVRATQTIAAATVAAKQATATAQAAQTLAAGSAQWKNTLVDSFDANANHWPIGAFADAFGTGSREVANSKYRWDLKANQSGISKALLLDDTSWGDFSVTVDGQRISGPADTSYGLIFRFVDENNYHIFRITDNRSFIFQSVISGTLTNSGTWRQTRAIQSGGVNQLRVTAQGSHFTFYINGEQVLEDEDSRLTSGKIGLAAGLFAQGDQARVDFDNFELRYP